MRRSISKLITAAMIVFGATMLLCGAPVSQKRAATTSATNPPAPTTPTPTPLPFDPAEQLVYEASISKSLLRGIAVADLTFTARRAARSDVKRSPQAAPVIEDLIFTAEAVSKGLVRRLFGVRFHERIESTIDAASFSVRRTVKLEEQNERRRTSEALFDDHASTVVWTERDPNNPQRAPRIVTSKFNGRLQDLVSAFYFLRTQPLAPDSIINLPVSDAAQTYNVPVKVSERKLMKTIFGEVMTVRVDPALFGDDNLLEGSGQVSIWMTDDARHIPVRARLTSDFGTINILLKRRVINP